jgi:hypothetical protein
MNRNVRLACFIPIAILFVLGSNSLFAGNREFHAVLHEVEHTCGVHHVRMPFVNLAIKMAKPFAGEDAQDMKDLHLAVFNLQGKQVHCPANLSDHVAQRLGPNWSPVVRVHSKTDNEDVVIFFEAAEEPRMIVASLDQSDAAVVQVRLTKHALSRWLNEDGSLKRHTAQNTDQQSVASNMSGRE